MGLMYIAFGRVISYAYLGFFLISMCREKLKLSVTNMSLENHLPTFQLNAPVVIRANVKEVQKNVSFTFALMMTGAFS